MITAMMSLPNTLNGLCFAFPVMEEKNTLYSSDNTRAIRIAQPIVWKIRYR